MKNPLTERINFYISVSFIGAFSLLMITTVMNVAHFDNPIADEAAALQTALQN